MDIMYKVLGWLEGGGEGGCVGKIKVGIHCHLSTDSGAVLPVGNRDVHSQHDRLRQILAAVWHPNDSD